ncbi:MAG: UvrB/UvrC motif-containing protein [Desulfitobacterium hafniense]|nr:UvrB/UvrC motif-containing protein [Desulfitobacterium hafniense]
MICQNCKQREANVHLFKTINGQTQELYLCEQCAKQSQEVNLVFQPGVIPDFLQALFGFNPSKTNNKPQEEACPNCGMTFSQITRAGKLGCSSCYGTFESHLGQALRRIHGSGQHVGKIPARRGTAIRSKLELKKLKEKLQLLIAQEKFEDAAVVRDQIKELESLKSAEGTGGGSNES